MSYMSFTKKFDDNSTEQGFEFVFYCDISGEPMKTKFIESRAGDKAGTTHLIGKGLSMGGEFLKNLSAGIPSIPKTTDKEVEKSEEFVEELSEKFGKLSPQWHKEHDAAFDTAQNEAKKSFSLCPVCNRWACNHCWDMQKKLCIDDAKNTLICSKCNQPAGTGKFCINCGTPLILKCPKCGAQHMENIKFCGECGAALE